jgi:hypothetical protein
VVVFWSGQTTGSFPSQAVISQPWLPASPLGQWTRQSAPSAQVTWQGPLWQVNSQELPGPQVQLPFAQVPTHAALLPAQLTWQGGAPHANVHADPASQVQLPFAQVPVHEASGPQLTWHGGLAQVKSQLDPSPQEQLPFAHAPSQDALSP